MPLKDVLWACPACHALEAIDARGECRSCRARLRRGRGARIVLSRAGALEELALPEWLARFPWPDLDGEGWSLPAGLAPPFGTRVIVRSEARRMPVRQASQYLGTVEVFGPRRQGTLSLTAEGVAFAPEDKSGGWQCPLVDLAAIQPASSTIQLRARGGPVVSLRFPEGSVRLWEQRLKFCTRAAWSDVGRGEIVEFQPRIRTR